MKKISFLILLSFIFIGLLNVSGSVFSQNGSIDQEIQELNEKIQAQKKQMDNLAEKQKAYQAAILKVSKDKNNLINQLAILENREEKLKLDIESTNINIDKTDLEIKKIQLDMENVDTDIETEKQHISNLLRLVYKQDQISAMEMLLLNDSLAEFLNQAKYLQNTNDKIKESLESLQTKRTQLEKSQTNLDEKNKELTYLKKELEKKVDNLSYEQESKEIILEETKSSEAEYQKLITQAKKEQLQMEAEIYSLEKTIRKKMSEKDKQKLESGSSDLNWPTSGRTITASFHDPDYPYRKIIGEHSGIDIRSPQGTTLKSAGDGYVARVKFDGTSAYAYIMIIHNNGLSTVYGHVSAVSVSADDYVKQGDIIGKTGGAPRGIGSGPFSTGSHLHFEVRKDGIPVNPMNYLP